MDMTAYALLKLAFRTSNDHEIEMRTEKQTSKQMNAHKQATLTLHPPQ